MRTGAFAPPSGHFPRRWDHALSSPSVLQKCFCKPPAKKPNAAGGEEFEEAFCMARRLLPTILAGNHAGRRARARDSQRA